MCHERAASGVVAAAECRSAVTYRDLFHSRGTAGVPLTAACAVPTRRGELMLVMMPKKRGDCGGVCAPRSDAGKLEVTGTRVCSEYGAYKTRTCSGLFNSDIGAAGSGGS